MDYDYRYLSSISDASVTLNSRTDCGERSESTKDLSMLLRSTQVREKRDDRSEY